MKIQICPQLTYTLKNQRLHLNRWTGLDVFIQMRWLRYVNNLEFHWHCWCCCWCCCNAYILSTNVCYSVECQNIDKPITLIIVIAKPTNNSCWNSPTGFFLITTQRYPKSFSNRKSQSAQKQPIFDTRLD